MRNTHMGFRVHPVLGLQSSVLIGHKINPPRRRYKEQTKEIFFGMWPTTVPSFITATAKASTRLPASVSHGNSSP